LELYWLHQMPAVSVLAEIKMHKKTIARFSYCGWQDNS
jgi:hypothetical protein